jgi:PAS domain S-box-containing protein
LAFSVWCEAGSLGRKLPATEAVGQAVDGTTVGGEATERMLGTPDEAVERLHGDGTRYRALLERHKLALAAARANVWEWDAATDLITTDHHILSPLLGFEVQEGRTLTQLLAAVHPDDRDHVAAVWTAVAEGSAETGTIECRVISDDGRAWWQRTTCVASEREDGRVRRVVGVSEDITERKLTEATLEEAYQRYTLATNAGRVMIWEWDGAANTTFEDGRTPPGVRGVDESKSLSGVEFMAALHPDDRERVLSAWNLVVTGASDRADTEYRIVGGDGAVLWMHIRYRAREHRETRVRRILGIAVDVTELKGAEQALRLSEERHRAFFELSAVGAGEVELTEGRFLRVNDALCQMVGYSRDELLRMRFAHLTHPDDLELDREQFQRLVRGEIGDYRIEKRYIRKDGAVIWVQTSTILVKDAAGAPVSAHGMVVDMTESKQAEQEIHRLANHLLHAQDEERRRIARELHDQTAQSLVAMNANLAVLETQPALADQARRVLSETVEMGRQVLQQIRTLSYLMHPPLLDELGLVSAAEWYVGGFSGRSGIEVTLTAAPGLGRLPADVELALFRVLQESLTNIHRHAGSTTVAVDLARDDHHITLQVADDGHGMEAVRPVGVGIAGMRERLRQLGGRLDIRSSPAGTTVTAVVPSGRAATDG